MAKIRQPKKEAVARLGLEVNVVELKFGQELRVSAEIFHEQGKYNSAMSTFEARAMLREGTDATAAAKTLVKYVEEVVGETVKSRIDEILEAIENRSSR